MITHFLISFSLSRGDVSNTQDSKHILLHFQTPSEDGVKIFVISLLVCFWSGRLFVEASIHDEYVHRVVSQAYS